MTEHPAKYSQPIADWFESFLEVEETLLGGTPLVLDPFAGIGGIHNIWPRAVGVELEPEWATQHVDNIVGNALQLPFRDGAFDVVATSPCYGNRLADHHDAKEKCKVCSGTGEIMTRNGPDQCMKCSGFGFRKYDRITYKHKLGRDLSEGSSAVMQWGRAYRAFHYRAWWEADRVLRPGGLFLLNIGDHIRGHRRMEVSKWHYRVLREIGYQQERRIKVRTRKMKKGANRDARVPYEYVICMRKEPF